MARSHVRNGEGKRVADGHRALWQSPAPTWAQSDAFDDRTVVLPLCGRLLLTERMEMRGLAELGPASQARAILAATMLVGAAVTWRCETGRAACTRPAVTVTQDLAATSAMRGLLGPVTRGFLRPAVAPRPAAAAAAHAIGTPGPIELLEAAPNGRWVAVCQERGGPMRPYVIRGEGEGQPVDGFVGSTPDGRWLAVLRDETFIVIDDHDGSEQVVAALDVLAHEGGFPTIRFASDSKHLLYVRALAGVRTVVIRDLGRGRDEVITIPRASVDDVDWTREDWVRLDLVRPPGRVDAPTPPESRSALTRHVSCSNGPLGSLHVPPPPSLTARSSERMWLKLDTGELRTRPPRLKRAEAAFAYDDRGDEEVIDGRWSLTYDRGRYVVTDRATGLVERVPGAIGAARRHAGSILAIDTILVDLLHPGLLGAVARPPLAVDTHGRALLPANIAEGVDLEGPLRWELPRPIVRPEEPPAEPANAAAAVGGMRWTVELTAVDGRGHPVKGATVRIDAPGRPPSPLDEAARWRRYPALRAAQLLESSEMLCPMAMGVSGQTDAKGRIRWSGSRVPQTLTVFAEDGRLRAVGVQPLGEARAQVELRPPGALRVVCSGFRSTDVVGDIALGFGWRTWRARCGETIEHLPAGRYALLANVDGTRVATTEADVVSGTAVEAVLEASPAAVIRGRVVEVPGDRPVAGMSCDVVVPFGDRRVAWGQPVVSGSDGRFALHGPHGEMQVECISKDLAFAPAIGRTHAKDPAAQTVRVVRPRKDAIDVGVNLTAEPEGARITRVSRRAWSAGLMVGDLVRAVDEIPLAGLSRIAMFVLAFELPPTAAVRWTVQRGERSLTITAPPW